jgi:hypothetical protein
MDDPWSEFDPAPTQLKHVLDTRWLSAMLQFRWPGTVVKEAVVVEQIVTMATKVRLALRLDDRCETAPTRICVKGVLLSTGAVAASSITETMFYRDVADALDVRVPHCIHAGLNAAGSNGVIVMEDLVAAGARFCSALEPCSAEQVARGLDELAMLHVAGREGTSLYAVPFASRFLERITGAPIMPVDVLQSLLHDPRGDVLPPKLRDAAVLQRALEGLAVLVRGQPSCLIHGDAHAGNVYVDANGDIGLVDWQVLQKGHWSQDVAYHVAALLTPEERRRHERELLDRYLTTIRSLGGAPVDREDAWRCYRASMIYAFYLWAMTRKVDPLVTYEFVRRLGFAVDDLDSYTLVGT